MKYSTNKPAFLILFMLLFSGAIILQSCDQPSGITFTDNDEQEKANFETTPFNSQSLPSLKYNNTLAFDSFEQFGQFMNEFGEAVNIEPDKWVEQKLGFSSSLQRAQNEGLFATESLNGRGTEKSREELVPDPWFASVLSEDGLIEVEGTVFQITENYTVIYEDWSAYNSYSNNIDVSTNRTVNERNVVKNSELEKVNDSVYLFRIEEHEEEIEYIEPDPGDGGGGGGTWCCPSERTATYRSGGKDGRLLGKSWNINYGLYSSFGSKSKHQRRGPLGIGWVARKANQIWLDSEAVFGYKRTMYPVTDALYDELSTLGNVSYNQVVNIFNQAAANAPHPGQATGSVTNLSNGHVYEVTVKITNWFSSSGGMSVHVKNAQLEYSHSKSEANTVKIVYDRDSITGIISSDEKPDFSLAQKFDVQYIDGFHKLLHDGHTREFQTRKGSVE